MINTADLIPTDPKTILLGFKKRAAVNNANALNDFQKMQMLANDMRKVLNAQCESYKKLVTDTYLDCDYKKVKVSKRVAKVPKYARSLTRARGQGNSFDVGGQKSKGRAFAGKVAI